MEKGEIDYLGVDIFDNIKKKLEETLCKSTEPQHETSSTSMAADPVLFTPHEAVSLRFSAQNLGNLLEKFGIIHKIY